MPTRPSILMLTPYLPAAPVSGGRRRTIELMRRLRCEVDITLVCLARPAERVWDTSMLRDLGELHVVSRHESPSVFRAGTRAVTSLRPLTVQLYESRKLRELVATLARRTDFAAVHVESFYMLQNVPRELAERVVLVEPDIESRAWCRYALHARPAAVRPVVALEAMKTKFWERRAWRAAKLLGFASELDRTYAGRENPRVSTFVAPNGVDVEHFRAGSAPREPHTALFLGDYKYFPNGDAAEFFIRDVLPKVLKKEPHFRLQLAGKDPSPRLHKLADRPGVELLGHVPDVRDAMARAAVFVCPLRVGSGTRLKLLEALACEAPIVTTSVGVEGLDVEPGRDLLIGDTGSAFAEHVLTLLSDRARAEALGREGRRWARRHASWDVGARALTDAYARAASAVSSAGITRAQS